MRVLPFVLRLIPGVLLCICVTLIAIGLKIAEYRLSGQAYLEGVVLAILLDAAIRTLWIPGARWFPGI